MSIAKQQQFTPKSVSDSTRTQNVFFQRNAYEDVPKLKAHIRQLQIKNNQLEAKNDQLTSNVIDLRILLKRVYTQNEKELQEQRFQNLKLKDRLISLQKALTCLHGQGRSLQNTSQLWKV